MTFSQFILSRNLLGGCFWLSMSKCLGTLRSRGLGGVVQREAGGKCWPRSRLWQTCTCIPFGAVMDAVAHTSLALIHAHPQPSRLPVCVPNLGARSHCLSPSVPGCCLHMGRQQLGMWQYPQCGSCWEPFNCCLGF